MADAYAYIATKFSNNKKKVTTCTILFKQSFLKPQNNVSVFFTSKSN